MKKYIDLHTHIFKEYYSNPNLEAKKNILQDIEKMFFVATSWNEINEVLELSKQYPKNLFPVLGIHPSVARDTENYLELEKYITENVVAIGEVGLDYYWENNPPKDVQKRCLIQQLEVALKFNKPVILHVRDAFEDIYEIIQQTPYNKLTYIFHTFSGDATWAEKFLALGCYLSFSGVITFKNATTVRAAALVTPLDRIFTETDSPYLTPVPHRGKRNHSYYVKHVTVFLAELKGISEEELLKQMHKNVKKVFNVD
ncbi:TatD family hydrolase [Mycoplasma iguanae]|uniref:TatD family hydrolase n=1 Tax=Mycoplasma iguanae TaxID=292461 RepID=A0ABY5R8K9_9MOLU|nr:TatD family hydrolase [Mycoplasma iguanae]UVD81616.1 TatD family hydrolase [Mycoplasma iguanae]